MNDSITPFIRFLIPAYLPKRLPTHETQRSKMIQFASNFRIIIFRQAPGLANTSTFEVILGQLFENINSKRPDLSNKFLIDLIRIVAPL